MMNVYIAYSAQLTDLAAGAGGGVLAVMAVLHNSQYRCIDMNAYIILWLPVSWESTEQKSIVSGYEKCSFRFLFWMRAPANCRYCGNANFYLYFCRAVAHIYISFLFLLLLLLLYYAHNSPL